MVSKGGVADTAMIAIGSWMFLGYIGAFLFLRREELLLGNWFILLFVLPLAVIGAALVFLELYRHKHRKKKEQQ